MPSGKQQLQLAYPSLYLSTLHKGAYTPVQLHLHIALAQGSHPTAPPASNPPVATEEFSISSHIVVPSGKKQLFSCWHTNPSLPCTREPSYTPVHLRFAIAQGSRSSAPPASSQHWLKSGHLSPSPATTPLIAAGLHSKGAYTPVKPSLL